MILKGKETKSQNHEFETISRPSSTDSSNTNKHDEFFATKNYQTIPKEGWMEITDPSIMDLIMKNYGDVFNRKILLCVTDTPRTISGILEACAIPQTTGYRKILKMIDDQLLIPFDIINKSGVKKIRQYVTTFTDVQIMVSGKVVTINARPNLNAKIESHINFLKH